ncbi:MAG: hypothetical protein AAFQ20_14255 [Bacteroidota bacterium]
MRKMKVFFIVLLSLWGCKEKPKEVVEQKAEIDFFDYRKMPKKHQVTSKVDSLLAPWKEFQMFTSSLGVLYKATTAEDLALAVEDVLEKEAELYKSEYPEAFDKSQVKSRQRVLRTYLLKVKADIANKIDATPATVEMLQANNEFHEQFDIVLGNVLNSELILDDE